MRARFRPKHEILLRRFEFIAFIGVVCCLAASACNPSSSSSLELSPTVFEGQSTEDDRRNSSPVNSNNRKIRCVSTTGMIGDLVREIGGSRIESQTLMGAGIDPHLFKPTRDDVVTIRASRALFYNGLHLEGRMGTVFENLPDGQLRLPVAEHLASIDRQDPHVWMDVRLWSEVPSLIADSLGKQLPSDATEFQSRAEKIQIELLQIDTWGESLIQSIPIQQRILVTSHDAFQYFGRRYKIQVESVQGISTDSEAGLQRISELVRLVVTKKLPAIFVESSVSSDTMKAIMEGCQAQGWKVSLGGPLYSDALGPKGSSADSYQGMMRHNFELITRMLKQPYE